MIQKKISKILITNKGLNYIRRMPYCLKPRRNTESKNLKEMRTKKRRRMFSSKCAVCNSKKSKFLKETKGLWSSIGIKTPLTQISLLGPLLF